ncbi:MAG: hypothetical protein P4L38_00675 [Syntrophaceae bacterium]|nr:hypothetical protein [Syntrophaceae bacterium]
MKPDSADGKQGITALFSPTESNRFNKRVVRFTITSSGIGRLKKLIELHYPDLAIVRFPSHRVDLVNALYRSFPEVIFGDCLVEYRIDLEQISVPGNQKHFDLGVLEAEETHIDALDHIVMYSFSDYKNHYSRNPRLKGFDLIPAYQEWVRSSVTSADKTCHLFFYHEILCGFFAAEKAGTVYRGLLSGIIPEYRRNGVFRGIIRSVKTIFQKDGATEIVTNVLLENGPVHKVLLDEGFVISNSFLTMHLNLRTSHTLPPSRRWGKMFKSITSTPRRPRPRSRLTDLPVNTRRSV